jgi:uncharacterized heparinase superfamily protein
MSLLERIETGEGEQQIEQGKRLIRADGGGAGLAERIVYGLQRLAWRMPFAAVRLRPRAPIKLLAVPKDPVAGDKALGEALLHGTMVYGGESVPVEGLDFDNPKLSAAFADHLHSFAWLRDLAAAATREKGARLAERITRHWLDTYSLRHEDPAWRADRWGRRILFWTSYAPYILSSRDMVYRATLLNTLARGARHLENSADKAMPGAPRIAAWAGVIAAAVVVQGGSARLSYGQSGLFRALQTALHDDGGLISRSPVEQLQLVELLGQLRTVYYAGRREIPERLEEALSGSIAALLAATLGDEALSSWQGGNMMSRRRVASAVEASGVQSRPLRQARGWGYQRLAAKNSVLVFDGAPPPTVRSGSGGCASTLAFEFSDGAHRIVVNCGGVEPWGGTPATELVQLLRYTAAHSTLTLGDRNSTAILQGGALGKGVSQVEVLRDENADGSSIEASHDGYVRRFGLLHERRLILSADGNELKGEDVLRPARRKRKGGEPMAFAVRFHLSPGIEAAITADGQGALMRVRGGPAWQFRCHEGKLAIEDSLWLDGAGVPHSSSQLVIAGECPPTGITLAWQFRRAS